MKVSIGGNTRVDDEGNRIGGRMIDMVVEGNGSVSIVSTSHQFLYGHRLTAY